MENQTIREQVFDVLFNYVKRADGIYTESDCATVRDEICLRIDQSQFTADEAEEHINHEVDKRIAERQLTDEQIERQFTTSHYHYEKGHYYKVRKDRIFGAKWYRSRLSQKTEGGGE